MSVQCMLGAHYGQRMASAALSVAWTAGTPPVQGLCHQLHTARTHKMAASLLTKLCLSPGKPESSLSSWTAEKQPLTHI